MLLIARVLHVVLGIFWVGAMLFNTFLLTPAMRDAGPDGAKVGAALMRRRLPTIMATAAVVTIISGLWLYWHVVGFDAAAMATARGLSFGAGGIAAIVALVFGLGVSRPAMQRSIALAQAAAAAAAAERPALLAAASAQRVRSARFNLFVALLMLFTAITMSIGRYV